MSLPSKHRLWRCFFSRASHLGMLMAMIAATPAIAQNSPTASDKSEPSASASAATSPESLRVQSVGNGLIQYLNRFASGQSLQLNLPQTQTLESQLGGAVRQHPEYQAALAQREGNQQGVKQAWSTYLPQVAINSGTGARRINGNDRPGAATGYTVSQMLFDFGSTGARVSAAEARESASQSGLAAKRQELAFKAIAAWHELFRAQQQWALHELNVRSRQEMADFVKERAELGGSAFSDVLRVRARQADAQAALTQAQFRLRSAQANWFEAWGQAAPGQVVGLPEARLKSLESYNDMGSLVRMFATVQQALANSVASEKDAQAQSSARWPSLNLELTHAKNPYATTPENEFDRSSLLVFRYNAYTGGADFAKTEQALARARQTAQEAQTEARKIERMLSQTLAEVDNASATLKARQMASGVAADTLEAVREQFAFRRGTLLDLLKAQEDLFYAGRDLIDAQVDTSIARFRLAWLASELETQYPQIGP